MKRNFFLQILFLLSTTLVFGQVINSETTQSTLKITKSCQQPVENRDIVLCNFKVDTLTYDQLKTCHELSIYGEEKQVITSYLLRYFLSDGTTLVEYQSSSNQISDLAIEAVISSKTKKIIVEEIIGLKDSEWLALGHRFFYFR